MSQPSSPNNHYGNNNTRICFICKKGDCWSTRHTKEERDKAREGFKRYIHQYLAENNIDKDIMAIVFNILTLTIVPTITSGNFFYNNYGVKYFITFK